MGDIKDVSEKRVYQVPVELSDKLADIAKYNHVTKSHFLRTEIRKKLETIEPKYLVKGDFRTVIITGISPSLKTQIRAIAQDIGITHNSLLKVLLYIIANEKEPNNKFYKRDLEL